MSHLKNAWIAKPSSEHYRNSLDLMPVWGETGRGSCTEILCILYNVISGVQFRLPIIQYCLEEHVKGSF